MPLETAQRAQLYVMGQFLLIGLFAVAVLVRPAAANPLWHGIGFAICVPGIAIIVWALATMGRVMQVSPEPRADGHLVTRGIYAWLRHPMYTGILFIVVGLLVRTPALVAAIVGVALAVLLVAKSRFEESLLLSRYPGYAEYRRGTWGVIPFIGRDRR
jgi:protein-S-isoprenylcysteine O-methyltransferase Ste14